MEGARSFQLLRSIWEIRNLILLFFPCVNLLIRKFSRSGFYYSALPEIAQTFEVELTCCNFLRRESLFLPAPLLLGSVMNLKKTPKKTGK